MCPLLWLPSSSLSDGLSRQEANESLWLWCLGPCHTILWLPQNLWSFSLETVELLLHSVHLRGLETGPTPAPMTMACLSVCLSRFQPLLKKWAAPSPVQ